MADRFSPSGLLTSAKKNGNEGFEDKNDTNQSISTSSNPCTAHVSDGTCLSLDQLKHVKHLFEVYDYVHALANGVLPYASGKPSVKHDGAHSSNRVHFGGKQSVAKTAQCRKNKAATKLQNSGDYHGGPLISVIKKTNPVKKDKVTFEGSDTSNELNTILFERGDYWEYVFGFDAATFGEGSLPDAATLVLMKTADQETMLGSSHEKRQSLNHEFTNILDSLQKLEKRRLPDSINMKKRNAGELLVFDSIGSFTPDHNKLEHTQELYNEAHRKRSIPHHDATYGFHQTQPKAQIGYINKERIFHSPFSMGNRFESKTSKCRNEQDRLSRQFWLHYDVCQTILKEETQQMMQWKRLQPFCKSQEVMYDGKVNAMMTAADSITAQREMNHLLALIKPSTDEAGSVECERFAFDALGLPTTKGVPFRFFAWFIVGPLFLSFFPNFAAPPSHARWQSASPLPDPFCTLEGLAGDAGNDAASSIASPRSPFQLAIHQQNSKPKAGGKRGHFKTGLTLYEPSIQSATDEALGTGQSGFCPWSVQHMEAIQQLFFFIDVNADGRVTWDDLISHVLKLGETTQSLNLATNKRGLAHSGDAKQEHIPLPIVNFFNFTAMPTNRSPWQASYPLVHHLYHREVFTKLLVCLRSSGYITAGPDGLVKLWKPDLCFSREKGLLTATNADKRNPDEAKASPKLLSASKKGSRKPPIVHARHLLSARAAVTDLTLSSTALGDAEVVAVAAVDGTVTLLRVSSGEVVRTFLGVRYGEGQIPSGVLPAKDPVGCPNGRMQEAGGGVGSPLEGAVSRLPYTIRAYRDDSIEIFFGRTSKYFKGLVVVPPTFEHLVRPVSSASDLLLDFGLQPRSASPRRPLSASASMPKGESVPWFATAVAMVNCPSLFPNARRRWAGKGRANTTLPEIHDAQSPGKGGLSEGGEEPEAVSFTGCLLLGFENGILQAFAMQRNWFSIHEWSMQENGYQEPPCVCRPLFSSRIHSAAITRLIVSEAANLLFTVSDDATICLHALSRLEAPALMQLGNNVVNPPRPVSGSATRGQRGQPPQGLAMGHSKRITCVCWSEQHRLLVTGGRDHMLIFWSPLMNRPIREIDVHNLVNLAAQSPSICSSSVKQDMGACGYPVDVSFFVRPIPGLSPENSFASIETPLWLLVLSKQRIIFILHALTGRLVKALVDHSASSLALGDLLVARYEVTCDRLLLGGYCLRVWDMESDSGVHPNNYVGHRQSILYMNYVPDLAVFITADKDEIWVWEASLEMVYLVHDTTSPDPSSEKEQGGSRSMGGKGALSLLGKDSNLLSSPPKSHFVDPNKGAGASEVQDVRTWRLKSRVMRSWYVSEGVSAVTMANTNNSSARQEWRESSGSSGGESPAKPTASSLLRLAMSPKSHGCAGGVVHTLFVALLREAAVVQYGILNATPLRRFELQPPPSLVNSLNACVGEPVDTLCSLCIGQKSVGLPSRTRVQDSHGNMPRKWSPLGRAPAKHVPPVFLCTVFSNPDPQTGLSAIYHVGDPLEGCGGGRGAASPKGIETSPVRVRVPPPRCPGKGFARALKGKPRPRSVGCSLPPLSPVREREREEEEEEAEGEGRGEDGIPRVRRPHRQLLFRDTPIAAVVGVDALGLVAVGGLGRLYTTRLAELTTRAMPCRVLGEPPLACDGREQRQRGHVGLLPPPPLNLIALFAGRLVPRPVRLSTQQSLTRAPSELIFPANAPTAQLLSCLLPIVLNARDGCSRLHFVVSGRYDGLVQLWDVDRMVECFRFQATWGSEVAVAALDYQCSDEATMHGVRTDPVTATPSSIQSSKHGMCQKDNVDGFLIVGDQAGCILLIGIDSSSLFDSQPLPEFVPLKCSAGVSTLPSQAQHPPGDSPRSSDFQEFPPISCSPCSTQTGTRSPMSQNAPTWRSSERAFTVLGRWGAHERSCGGVQAVRFFGPPNHFERSDTNKRFGHGVSQEITSSVTLRGTVSYQSMQPSMACMESPIANDRAPECAPIFIVSAGADSFVYVWRWEQELGVQCIGCFGGDNVTAWPVNSIPASHVAPPFNFPPHSSWCQSYEDARCQYVFNRLIKDAFFFVVPHVESTVLLSPSRQQTSSYSRVTDSKSDPVSTQSEKRFLNDIARALLFMAREVHALVAMDPAWKHSARFFEDDILKEYGDCVKDLEKASNSKVSMMSITQTQDISQKKHPHVGMLGNHDFDNACIDYPLSAHSWVIASEYAPYVFAFMPRSFTNASLRECLEHTVKTVLMTPEGAAAVHVASNKIPPCHHSITTGESAFIGTKGTAHKRSIPYVTLDSTFIETKDKKPTADLASLLPSLSEPGTRYGSMKRVLAQPRVGLLEKRSSTHAYDFETVSSVGTLLSTDDCSKSVPTLKRASNAPTEVDLQNESRSSQIGLPLTGSDGTALESRVEAYDPGSESHQYYAKSPIKRIKVPLDVAAALPSRVLENEKADVKSRSGGSFANADKGLHLTFLNAPPQVNKQLGLKAQKAKSNPLSREFVTVLSPQEHTQRQQEKILRDNFVLTRKGSLGKNFANQETKDMAVMSGMRGLTAYREFAAATASEKKPGDAIETNSASKKAAFEGPSQQRRSRVAGRAFIQEILSQHAKAVTSSKGWRVSVSLGPPSVETASISVNAPTTIQPTDHSQGEENWYARRERLHLEQRREEAMWNVRRVMRSVMAWSSKEPLPTRGRLVGEGALSSPSLTHYGSMNETGDWGSNTSLKLQPMTTLSGDAYLVAAPSAGPERTIPSFIPLHLKPHKFSYLEISADEGKSQPFESKTNNNNNNEAATPEEQGQPTFPSAAVPRGKAFLRLQAKEETSAMHFHHTVAAEVEAMRRRILSAAIEREKLNYE